MSIYVKRSPYPFHIFINGRGYMIGSPGPNQPAMVSAKAQDISQVAPPDYNYAGLSPINEREEPYESLALGMGLKIQENWEDTRYANAMGVDCSVWPWCKGPDVTDTTPATLAGEVVGFFELSGTLYCAAGTQVYSFNTGTGAWTSVATFAQPIQSTATFTSNFDGVPRAWLAFGASLPVRHSSNGTTWTPMSTFTALAFASLGREWWWADDTNRLRKCDTNADPTNEANYTSLQFRAGDKAAPITALAVTSAGTLLILKTDGIYTLDAQGNDRQLFPFLRYAPVGRNGKAWGQFLDDVYVSYGTQFSRISGELGLTEVGPERLVNNDGPVRGQITAFVGLGTMFAYAGIYNPDTSRSYLMKFGGWLSSSSDSTSDALSKVERVDAWHGALNGGWSNSFISKLHVSSIGAPSGHTRTYIGRSDGGLSWILNPCVPNPAACSQYRFETGDAWVELPLWHGTYHASIKSIRHVAISSTFLDANNTVTVDIATTPAATPADIGHVFQTPTYEQYNLPTDTTTTLAKFRVHLHNTSNTTSPLVSAFIVGHALRPLRVMQFEADILCADGLVRRDGVQMRMGRQMIRQFVEEAVDDPGAVECILPDERRVSLSFTNYQISQAFDEVGRQWRGALKVRAVEWAA
jgi:hypothetical protein